MKKILLGLALLTLGAMAKFTTIDNDMLLKMQAKGIPVIDIRTPGEWQTTGIIKGSHKMMFFNDKGQPDMGNWFFDLGHLIKDKEQPIIILCAFANRSKALGGFLDKQLGFKNVFDLKDGIENGWIKAGKPVVK
jgi:rhodanese-related sulfurtransferase